MSTFIMLTRLSHEGLRSPRSVEKLAEIVSGRIKTECPEVRWVTSYAILGPADYVDIFTAPNIEEAMKVATIIRTFGHATTEVWGATPWREFTGLLKNMPAGEFLTQQS